MRKANGSADWVKEIFSGREVGECGGGRDCRMTVVDPSPPVLRRDRFWIFDWKRVEEEPEQNGPATVLTSLPDPVFPCFARRIG